MTDKKNDLATKSTRDAEIVTVESPKLHARASFVPESIQDEARTVELIWSTGERGKRAWAAYCEGEHFEELGMDVDNIRMGRLDAGAPLLDNHDQHSNDAVIGVVESAWIANGQGYARVKFARDERSDAVYQKVRDGILTSVSVGYAVHRVEMIGHTDDGYKVFRAVDWEPMEVSMVPIGFDSKAKTRSDDSEQLFTVEITNRAELPAHELSNGENMSEVVQNEAAPVVETERAAEPVAVAPVLETPAPVAAPVDSRSDAVAIVRACEKHGLSASESAEMIERGLDIAAANAEILSKLESRAAVVSSAPAVQVGENQAEQAIRDMGEYVVARANGAPVSELSDGAKSFRGSSLLDMARTTLELNGVSHRGLSKPDLVKLALSPANRGITGGMGTSDFTNLLADSTTKQLRMAYDRTPQTFQAFGNRRSAADFKTLNSVGMGGVATFNEVNEHGEFERGSIDENNETYAVTTRGVIIPITRQAIINDDLGAFGRIASEMGSAAADTQSDIVYSLIMDNGNMSDGAAFFSGSNTIAAATIGTTPLQSARHYFRTVTGIGDGRYLNLSARWLVVGPDKETEADQFVAQRYYPASTSAVVPDSLRLEVIVDPRITDASWYVVADNNRISGVEYAYLQDQDGVYTETRDGFEVDGIEIKARMDFGAGLVDRRGWFRVAA